MPAVVLKLTFLFVLSSLNLVYASERSFDDLAVIDATAHEISSRKFALYVRAMEAVKIDFKKNPDKYFDQHTSPKYGTTSRISLTEKQALSRASTEIKKTLDGYDYGKDPFISTGLSALALAYPPYSTLAVNAIKQMDLSVPGNTPEVSQKETKKYLLKGLELSKEDSELGKLIAQQRKEYLKPNDCFDECSDHPAARAARSEKLQIESLGLTEAMEEKMHTLVQDLEALQQFQTEKLKAENKIKEYEFKKQELIGGFSALGTALDWLGMEKESDLVYRSRNLVVKLLDLSRFSRGPLALTSGYMGAGNMLLDLFSQHQSADATTHKMLQALLKQVQQIRKEMHERFDRVDRALAEIFQHQVIKLQSLKEDIANLNMHIVGLQEELDNRFADLENLNLAVEERSVINDLGECINWRTESPIAREAETILKCLNNLSLWGNVFSRHEDFTDRAFTQVHNSSTDFPFSSSLLRVSKELKQVPSFRKEVLDTLTDFDRAGGLLQYINKERLNLPNPQMWQRYSTIFLRFLSEGPNYLSYVTANEFDAFIEAGTNIGFFYRHLLLNESREIRMNVINKILKGYTAGFSGDVFDLIYSDTIYSDDLKKQINLGKDFEQASSEQVEFLESKSTLKWCDNHANFGIKRIVGSHDSNGDPDFDKEFSPHSLKRINAAITDPVVAQKLRLPKNFKKYIPAELKFAEMLGLGKVAFCAKRFTVDNLTLHSANDPDHPRALERTAHVNFLVKGMFTSSTDKRDSFYFVRLSDNKKIKMVDTYPVFAPIYSWIWHGKPGVNRGAPLKKRLRKTKNLSQKILFSSEDRERLMKRISAKRSELQLKSLSELFRRNQFQDAAKIIGNKLSLLNATLFVGLGRSLNTEDFARLFKYVNSNGGLVTLSDVAKLAVIEGKDAKQVVKLRDDRVASLQNFLSKLNSKNLEPRSHPTIEQQILLLKRAKELAEAHNLPE